MSAPKSPGEPLISALRQLMHESSLPSILLREDGTISDTNLALRNLLGSMRGTPLQEWVHPHDWQQLHPLLSASASSSFMWGFRLGWPQAWHYCLLTGQRWAADDGEWLITLKDVSNNVTRLRQGDALIEAGLGLNWSIWAYYPATGRHVYPPKTYDLVTGNAAEAERQISHDHFLSIVHPDDRERVDGTLSHAFETRQGYHSIYRFMRPSGEIRWVQSIGTATTDLNDESLLMGIVTDVTEERRKSEEAARAQRLESMGLLAGGIAHDFNNQLTVIIGYLSLIEGSLGQEWSDPHLLATQAAEKARNLARQLLALARNAPIQRQRVVVEPLLHDCRQWVIGQGANLSTTIADSSVAVEGDPVQLAQVFENIIRNAVEAMSGEGTVYVDARLTIDRESRQMVEVTIEDEGPGIAEELRDRLFDPYYSTKPKGHGLGLASVHAIIRQHGGSIRIESGRSGGALFRLWLPAAIGGETLSNLGFEDTPQRLEGVVMVIDDDPLVRATARPLLESLGLQVETVADGGEALEWLSCHSCNAILLDWVMPPPMNGYAVLERIRAAHPNLPIVVSSGFADIPIPTGVPTLPKPYTRSDLAHMLAPLLTSGHSSVER